MAKLFLNLRNVPGDEADDVRDLLRANAIDFYETQPSPWGISAGGLWIEDVDQLTRAKALMADYQARRRTQAREDRAAAEAVAVGVLQPARAPSEARAENFRKSRRGSTTPSSRWMCSRRGRVRPAT